MFTQPVEPSQRKQVFSKIFVTLVLWAIIHGFPVDISKKGSQNCILRFQKYFSTFFFKYLESHNILGLWKKYFPLFGKRVSERLSNLPLRVHNRDLWGEKFLLIKISTFYYDCSEFRMKTFEHSTKKWVELPKLQFICPAEVFEKKKFLKRINFTFSLGLPERNFGSSGEKCFGVRVGVCVGVGTANTTFYMPRKTFWEIALFWKVCSFIFFRDFGREIFDSFAWTFGGFAWTAQKKNLGNKTFLKKFQISRVIEFWSKKNGGVAETAFTCLAEVFEKFFWKKSFSIVNLAHPVSGFGTSGGKFSYRGVRKLHSTCLHLNILMKNQCFEQM